MVCSRPKRWCTGPDTGEMPNFQHFYLLHYSMAKSTHDARIELAIADLNQQEIPNIMGTAKKFNLVESTLRRRWKGKTLSHGPRGRTYTTNQFPDCHGLPPTSRIVRNFAEETIGESVGKNWTSDFVRRYKDRFKSLYLRNIMLRNGEGCRGSAGRE